MEPRESRAVSVGGGSALPRLCLRSLLSHGPSCLSTSVPARACLVPLVSACACPCCPCHPSCLYCLVLLLPPVPACPAHTPWTSNPQPLPLVLFIAGRDLMDVCWGLYPLAVYIHLICTMEDRSCFLWEMGEERRTNPLSSSLSQTWKQFPRHLPSPT